MSRGRDPTLIRLGSMMFVALTPARRILQRIGWLPKDCKCGKHARVIDEWDRRHRISDRLASALRVWPRR